MRPSWWVIADQYYHDWFCHKKSVSKFGVYRQIHFNGGYCNIKYSNHLSNSLIQNGKQETGISIRMANQYP